MRHLSRSHIESALKRGKEVEQFIGGFEYEGRKSISWLTIRSTDFGYTLLHHEQFDEGSSDFCDVYEYEYINLPEYRYEPEHLNLKSLDDVFEAASKIGATENRWVGHGMVQDEYHDYTNKNT
jgi:hypothetical protein